MTSGELGNGHRICVLQSDALVSDLICTGLATCEVIVTTSVPDLISAIAHAPTQFVIVELGSDRALATPLFNALACLPQRPPVLAILASFDDETLASYMRNVIDDVLLRPFTVEALHLRLRLMWLGLSLGLDLGPTLKVLRAAMLRRANGEVFVRTVRGGGRVLLSNGEVAWVHCPWRPNALKQALKSAGVEVETSTVEDIVREAMIRAVPISDVVSDWKLVSHDRFESELRQEFSDAVRDLLGDQNGTAMLIPNDWIETRRPSFNIPVGVSTGMFASMAHFDKEVRPALGIIAEAEQLVRSLMLIRGAQACAIFKLDANQPPIAMQGPIELELAWALLATLRIKRRVGLPVNQNYCTTGDVLHGIWRLDPNKNTAAFVMFDLDDTVVGLVLRQVREVIEES